MSTTLEISAPNMEFANLADSDRVARTANALEANGFRTIIVESAEEAKRTVLDLLPEGGEIFDSSSQTLEHLGITSEIAESPRFRAIRPRLMELYAQGDRTGMRKIGAAPDVVVGSVHAVTEQGEVIVGSGSGSQLGPYAFGAGNVIWVVGVQKLVGSLEEGLRRVREYSLPLESERLLKVAGYPSSLNKILIVNKESVPDRVTVVLVNQALGF